MITGDNQYFEQSINRLFILVGISGFQSGYMYNRNHNIFVEASPSKKKESDISKTLGRTCNATETVTNAAGVLYHPNSLQRSFDTHPTPASGARAGTLLEFRIVSFFSGINCLKP